eukprot:CAMPEP_0197916522 /NCGR_PEP_ID=MMETSP1439-20131203/82123_1 /TAXON_ID=66791 /ORGANISM="Gonyaulax spinifera, Strain CCMP409" /LENGTH=225 /DNA_ID=CAMNT_0043538551 /DNA_START=23 /DNA_END=700 /DNA_ORIENTATION=+
MAGLARALGGRYWELCKRLPLTTAFTVCYFKGSLSDVFAQKCLEGRAQVDVKRTAIYGGFGGWYCGWFQHFLYNIAYSKLFGRGKDWSTVCKKLLVDHFVHVPFFCMPLYFLWQESLLIPLRHGGTVPRCDVGLLRDAGERWRADIFEIMCAYWKLWTPAHLVTFGLVPEPLRITWVAGVSGIWLVIHSYLTHGGLATQRTRRAQDKLAASAAAEPQPAVQPAPT